MDKEVECLCNILLLHILCRFVLLGTGSTTAMSPTHFQCTAVSRDWASLTGRRNSKSIFVQCSHYCRRFAVASQLASAYMKRRLSVTNLSSENNLPTFWLNTPVAIRAPWWWLEHSIKASAVIFWAQVDNLLFTVVDSISGFCFCLTTIPLVIFRTIPNLMLYSLLLLLLILWQ